MLFVTEMKLICIFQIPELKQAAFFCSSTISQTKRDSAVDKTRNTEHHGTFRNILEHEKIKVIFMKK